jgi:hypothetical protein
MNAKYKEGQTATNQQTGERVVYRNGSWIPDQPLQKMSAADVGVGFVSNFPSSVGKMASDTYQAVRHPLDTLGGMRDVATGVFQKGRNLSPPEFRGAAPAFDESTANAAGQYLKDRFGGAEEIKRTIATDPAGALSDLASVLTGGGSAAARLPGIAGKAGQITKNVGRSIEPIGMASKAVSTVASKVVTPVLREAVGFSTGAGGRSISEAAKAGFEGGKQAEAFRENISSRASTRDVVDQAKSALEKIKEDRSKAYTSGMVDIKSDASIIDMKPISNKVNEIRNRGFFKNKIIDESAAETWIKINKVVDDWIKSDPLEYHTPEGLDALKRRIGNIKDTEVHGTPSFNAASNVFNAIRGEIVSQAPTYARVMKEYSDASDIISEIDGALSLRNKALADTGLRKLQSLMRNNVQTNYGRRAELGDILVKSGADTLYPSLAGQSLSSLAPRSMSGQIMGAGGALTALSNPSLIPAIAMTSPRIMGEAAYYSGKAAGGPKRLIAMLSKYGDKLGQTNPQMGFLIDYAKRAGGAVDPTIARLLAEQLGRMQQSEERQAQ